MLRILELLVEFSTISFSQLFKSQFRIDFFFLTLHKDSSISGVSLDLEKKNSGIFADKIYWLQLVVELSLLVVVVFQKVEAHKLVFVSLILKIILV